MRHFLLLFIAVFFLAGTLPAQDVLDSVVVSPAPGQQLSAISKTDIAVRKINNSQEVLRIVPGLFIGQHAGGGKAEQMFLRGFDLDHGTDINITVDGIPVNMVSHAHGQGYADLHFVIPELIENAHFQKGPYYAEKGNLATTGYVDFRTKNILQQNMVKLEAGMFNTYRAVGMAKLFKGMYTATEYMHTDGYFDHPQDFNRVNFFTKYYGKLNANNTLNISASTFHSKWNASGQIPERAVNEGLISFFGAIDPNEGGKTNRTNLNVQLNTGTHLKNQVYYTAYDFELYSNFTFFNVDSINGDQIKQKEKRDLFGYNGSYTKVHQKLTSEIGLNIRYDRTHNSELSRTKSQKELKLGDIRELNTGLYLDETVQLNEKFSLNAGLRWDNFAVSYRDKLNNNSISRKNNSIVSPKLNFYYHPNERTNIYLTTGKGFHSNDVRVMDRQALPAAYGADLGITVKATRNLLLNFALWHLYLEQEFVYVGDEGVVEPSGKTRRKGIDLSVRYQPFKWLVADADANYCHGRNIDGSYIPLAPVFTSTGGFTVKSKIGLNGSLRYRYMHDRPANENKTVIAKGYFINDVVLSFAKRRYEVSMTVQNIFNEKWKETQFDTESRLQNEPGPVSEIHFTPGTPLFIKIGASYAF